jgi:tRNA-Thr(GGU) m(6)t(6)A37 methyltransferase TsaA
MGYTMEPIGTVMGGRAEAIDDDWGEVVSTVVLDASRVGPDAAVGLEEFSHVEVVFVFDKVDPADVVIGARHPRGNTAWPKVGILAQRARLRPNRIGVTVCELVSVEGAVLTVRGLDAVDGSPVLDVKPYMAEFAPRGALRQPVWSSELMRDYW